jgi:hypothetical protein
MQPDERHPIDRIFDRLSSTYGKPFLDLYAGTPMGDVKTAWAHELAPFATRAGLSAIAWALDNLPERPPNAVQFRNLCRQAPAQPAPRLPEPEADPRRVQAAVADLGAVRNAVGAVSAAGDRERARANLQRLIDSGKRLTHAQAAMARAILGDGSGAAR